MAKEELKINQKVEIRLDNASYKGSYPSRVEELPSNRITLAAPIKKGKIIPLGRGDIITVYYWTQTAGYSFTTRVIKTGFRRIPTITVERPREMKRIQRRNYLRIPAILPITFSVLEDLEHVSRLEIYRGETIDISGGGVMFKSPIKLTEDVCLEMEITLPRKGTVNVGGRVVRIREKLGKSGPEFFVGVDFSVIDESDRDKIIGFVFQRQREMRRKGLI